jgi:signal transduction histidine kinase
LTIAKEDTNKVLLLSDLSFEYYTFDTDAGTYYGEKALALAEKLKWHSGIALACKSLGVNYAVKAIYPKALEYFTKSLSIYTELGDKKNIAGLSNSLGLFYVEQKKADEALKYFNKAISLNKELQNKSGLASNYLNLGLLYSYKKDFAKSFAYYSKALKINEELKDKKGIFLMLTNIATDKQEMQEYCDALEYGFKALKISTEINNPYYLGLANTGIGEIYLSIATDSTNGLHSCSYYANDKSENLLHARKYLSTAIPLFTEVADYYSLSTTSLSLSHVYEKFKDYKNALFYYKKYSENIDSVFSRDNSVKIANIEKKREVELRDKQLVIKTLAIEKKNTEILLEVLFFSVIIIIISLLSYFLFKKQKYQKAINKELDLKNEELIKLNATKDKFFSIIAHDLKSPFLGLLGLSQMMATDDGTFTKTELLGLAKNMHKSTSNLYKLLENLLEWSQMQGGLLGYVPKEIDLSFLVLQNIEAIYQRAIQKGITLINEVNADQKVFADEEMINTVIRNLVSNAVKFTSKGGKIIIAAKPIENNILEISVSDTGVGMDENAINLLFKIEEKVGTRGTEGESSTGLGLLLCKDFVEKNGGKIWVESKIGIGSDFRFTLPLFTGQESDVIEG